MSITDTKSSHPTEWVSFDEAYKWFEQGFWIRPRNKKRPGLLGFYYLHEGQIRTYDTEAKSWIGFQPKVVFVNAHSQGYYSNPPTKNPGSFDWRELQLEWEVVDGERLVREEKERAEKENQAKADELERLWLADPETPEREKERYLNAKYDIFKNREWSTYTFWTCKDYARTYVGDTEVGSAWTEREEDKKPWWKFWQKKGET